MKNNKKGFTLIELLAVIAILAILIVIAVPSVLNLFNNAKESSFVTQAQSIYKTAQQQRIAKELDGGAGNIFCYIPKGFATASTPANDVSLEAMEMDSSKNLAYRIEFNQGEIVRIQVLQKDKTYVNVGTGSTAVSISDITTVSEFSGTNLPTTCTTAW